MSDPSSTSWRPPTHTERMWRLADTSDLETTLAAAERLLGRAEEERRHVQNIRIALISLASVTIASLAGFLIGLYERRYDSLETTLFAVSLLSLGTIALSFLIRFFVRTFRSSSSHIIKQMIALDMASMVSETYLDVASRFEWSHFRVEALRLRLAAFPLDERKIREEVPPTPPVVRERQQGAEGRHPGSEP